MPTIFQNLGILEILRLGLAGLCFLLSLLAFWLIRNEQRRESAPRQGILRASYAFLFLSLLVAGLAGAASYLGPRPDAGKADDLNAKTYLVEHTWYLVDLSRWSEPVGPVEITRTDFIHKVSNTTEDYVIPYFTSGTRIEANFKTYSRSPKFEPTVVEGASGAHYLYRVPLGDQRAGSSETVSTIFTFADGFRGDDAKWWEASVQYPSRTVSVEFVFPPGKACKSIQAYAIPGIGEKRPLSDNEPVVSNEGKMAMWVGENIEPNSRIHFAWEW